MPIPVILDCDPGTDDAVAILLALASPELTVLAITVAGGNVGLQHTLPNALALTALAGSDVPVHAGADRPLLGAFVSEVAFDQAACMSSREGRSGRFQRRGQDLLDVAVLRGVVGQVIPG